MSVLNPQVLRRDLLLKKVIDQQLDTLVQRANTTAALLERTRMEKNQLRNLLSVAVTSRSQAVVINFIRYQIARDKDKWSTDAQGFGHTVIADLQTQVAAWADTVATAVRKEMPDVPEADTLRSTAYIELMQLYLGYVNRAFYYAKETSDWRALHG